MNGIDLLKEFAARRSEAAFTELVHRYTNLVYSVAHRHLESLSLAQEAAQRVFIRLAQSAPQLGGDAELMAWLHRTTVHVSIDLWRSEIRRRAREEHAAAMQLNETADEGWKELAPALDEALNELNDHDRQAILLRFFQDLSMRELGGAFGISEDAAKMRVSRAVDKLRTQLSAHGVSCTAAALGALMLEHSVEAAPAEVSAAIAGYCYGEGSSTTAATGGAHTVTGMAKITAGMAVLALFGISTWLLVVRERTAQPVTRLDKSSAPAIANERPVGNSPQLAGQSAANAEPDPWRLLRAVVQARQRIASGSINFNVETFHPANRETNQWLVAAVFDGAKRRVEQRGRQYAYTYDSDTAKQEQIVAKADAFGSDREGAIQAGLLEASEVHYVTTVDGTAILQYRESNGAGAATIDDLAKGTSAFVFDPRCLGLTPGLAALSLEAWWAWISTNSVQLAGRESVDGVAAWHLLHASESWREDLWLDIAHPTRVLKVQSGAAVALSRYDSDGGKSPIPVEVMITYLRNGATTFGTHLLQTASQLNTTVDPATFTLSGLSMKIGSDVVDIRIHRSIGHWTGTGLSSALPRNTVAATEDEPRLVELLSILDNTDPASEAAGEAAQAILLNSPDGPAVEKAAAVILHHHVQDASMAALCPSLERMRHRASGELLQAILKENPQPEVRALACFSLATLRKDQCHHGADKTLAAQAEKLFERVLSEFGQAGANAADLSGKAALELSELRRLSIGKPAPELAGTDLDGQMLRLNQYRGKVVVLVFWEQSSTDLPAEHRRLLSTMESSIAWVGIYCENQLGMAADVVEKHQIPGPVILDGRSGPIALDWNVHSWPTVYVIDRKGVIRSRDVRGVAFREAMAALVRE